MDVCFSEYTKYDEISPNPVSESKYNKYFKKSVVANVIFQTSSATWYI